MYIKAKFVTVGTLLIISLLLQTHTKGLSQTIRYVKENGTGNGSSWDNASGDLQAMIDAVSILDGQVWVAAGIYKPHASDRSVSFEMRRGVAIYGGFPRTGNPIMANRNWSTNPTILSGDLNGDDVVSGDNLTILNNGENSYHVLSNIDNSLSPENSLLDGFIITGGNANGTGASSQGGGMYNFLTSPGLRNLVFTRNVAIDGGGMYNFRTGLELSQVAFWANQATNNGGGMHNIRFLGSINSATISGNTAANVGGGIYNRGASPTFLNSIIWGNGDEVYNESSEVTYNYSLVRGLNPTGTGNLDGTDAANDPLFVDAAAGNLYLQTASPAIDAGDPTSSTATVGSKDLAGNPRFYDGGRIDIGAYEYPSNNWCANCPNNSDGIIYVNAIATGSNNGCSWENAFTDLQSALDLARNYRCINQIWVASGTYKPHASDRSVSFEMRRGVAIYGGFPRTGNPIMANRNWSTNPTILSGDLNGDDVVSSDNLTILNNGENSYHVLSNIDNSLSPANSLLDGFIITGGNANGSGTNSRGGGMYNFLTSPGLRNLVFRRNSATDGGGMYNFRTGLELSQVAFWANQATNNGGGMHNIRFLGSINSATIAGNTAGNVGGGIYNLGSSPTFLNSIIWGNGDEVYSENSSETYNYSLVRGLNPTGTGNLDGTDVANDPLFVDAAAGNLRLQACSPLINAGDPNNTATVGSKDLAGNPRFHNDGRIDVGAYEYQGNAVAQPTASASTTTPTVCVGNTIRLSASGGNNFSWRGPRGSNFSSTEQSPIFSSMSASYSGVYTVSVSNDNCLLKATATVSIRVNSEVVAGSNSPVCVGTNIQLSTSGGTAWTWSGPNFSSNNQHPSIAGASLANSGVYSVTVSTNSCTQLVTTQVIINQFTPPTLSSNSPVCVGSTLRLSLTGSGATYSWSPIAGFISTLQSPTRPNATVAMSGTYSVTVNGVCGSTVLTTSVVVSPNVAPSITSLRFNNVLPNAQNTVSACSNAAVTLTVAATNAVTYSWRGPTGAGSGFASSVANPVNMPIATPRQGQYTVTVRNGCSVFNQRVINLQLINCPNTRIASAVVPAMEPEIKLVAYPSPVGNHLNVELRLPEPQPLQLRLLNMTGQESRQWEMGETSATHQTQLDLQGLPSGMYLLQAQAGPLRVVKKIVKLAN